MANESTNQEAESSSAASSQNSNGERARADAQARLQTSGRNDSCGCGSGKKYKKCHLLADEQLTAPPLQAPDAQRFLAEAWGLFEQRRPGAAERSFRAALDLNPSLTDARVGIGMSRLSANDAEGAKVELGAVVSGADSVFEKLREDKVKDAFTRAEIQPLIRATHALGCLAYDQERYTDAFGLLQKVFEVDEGPVGTEARLISAKVLLKEARAADAIQVLEPAVKSESGGSRAHLGLALAKFLSGAPDDARVSLDAALQANPHFAKALLGRIRRRVENLAGTQPGSIEEALVYTQTYGDVWTAEAKAFLEAEVDARAAQQKDAARAPSVEAPPEASPAP
jgi:tetratricopeptide (TPR) repeat protein